MFVISVCFGYVWEDRRFSLFCVLDCWINVLEIFLEIFSVPFFFSLSFFLGRGYLNYLSFWVICFHLFSSGNSLGESKDGEES